MARSPQEGGPAPDFELELGLDFQTVGDLREALDTLPGAARA